MKLNTTDFLRKCQHPLQLALGLLPVAFILIMNNAPEILPRLWAVPTAFVLIAWGCILLPGKRRLLRGIVGAALLITLGIVQLNVQMKPLLILLPVMYAALVFVTLPIGGWDRGHELNVAWHVSGLLLYVLLQLLINGSRMLGPDMYAPINTPVLLSFLAYACLVVLALNRTSLDNAAMSRRTVPVLMRRQNLVIAMAMLALGVLIAAIPAIGEVLGKLWDAVMQGIGYLAALLMTLLPKQQGAGGAAPGEPDSMGFGAAKEPSALAVFLEKLLMVGVGLLLIVLAFFAGRALIKRLIRLGKYLWARFGEYSAAAGEDYEDEITDTREEPGVERSSLLGRLRRMSLMDEKGLSPNESIRWRYRRLKRKHSDWTQANTARETLPEAAASLYERVRYGGETLTEAEAAQFREETRRV